MNNQELLRPMFSYSILPLFLTLLAIGIVLYMLLKKPNKKEKPPVIIRPSLKNLFEIKNRYEKALYILENDYKNNKVSNRKAYQKLSMLIRNFIFEVTHIRVQNYSLQEIKKLNIAPLTELVEEYYNPEFAKESKETILESIDKTEGVIESWK